MNIKIDDKLFMATVVETNNLKKASEILKMSYGGVTARAKRLRNKGMLSIVNGKYTIIDPDIIENKEEKPIENNRSLNNEVVKSYKPERDPEETLGNPKNSGGIQIDTSDASEGLRFLKHKDTLDRIDIIMSQMKESDSAEIKGLFRTLVCKIFESSLK